MKNQYEIDYQQGYDKANEEWLDRIDKIRDEIEARIGEHNFDDYDFCSGLICARNIIDKYRKEQE